MKNYDHRKIEKKWQKEWDKKKAHVVKDKVAGKKNEYVLVEFPYPSGNLHVGHWYAFAMPDIYARFRRAQGKNVMFPMGFDAFGLPAENAAIKNGLNPQKWTKQNIAYMKKQLASMGASFDWSREVATIDPAYYKWTQWQFLQFYKKGLAYQKETPANWCPKDKTVLANEQVVDGKCERCGTEVEQRLMLQWNLKITDYADRLIDDLTALDWPEQIKESQRNWIGRSEGAEIDFGLDVGKKYKFVILHGFESAPDRPRWVWAKAKLEELGHEVILPRLPNPNAPTEEEWVSAALSATTYDENTVLVGHSLGSVAALKVLEKLDRPIARLVTVGGFISKNFKDNPRPFEKTFTWTFDGEKIRNNVGSITILHDPQDYAVSDAQAAELSALLQTPITIGTSTKPHFTGDQEPDVVMWLRPTMRVFTTRPDTLFGATYLVLAPEHPFVTLAIDDKHTGVLENRDAVAAYVAASKKKSELERQESKEKTGVQLEGVMAINPASGERVPVYIADYVLGHYGTGAIMAVPAHDERDFEFAKKFGLPIKKVVDPVFVGQREDDKPKAGMPIVDRPAITAVVKHWSEDKYLILDWKQVAWHTLITGGIEEGQSAEDAARREIHEETGFKNLKLVRTLMSYHSKFYHTPKGRNQFAHFDSFYFELENSEQDPIANEEASKHSMRWVSRDEVMGTLVPRGQKYLWSTVWQESACTETGILVDSGEFAGMENEEAKIAITEKYGRAKKTYRLRDWGVSRQRYWGVPIPIIHCEKCGAVPVPDKDLPVKLPEVKDYLPDGNGKSPLAKAEKWVNVKCPQCKNNAQRETDTLDTFVDSSWYFLRYLDPKNKKQFADKKKQKLWMPIDLYSGGAEHTTMHLLYSRFWYKALYDLKLVNEKEPYTRRMNRGLILGPDGQKMSKSKGNVIDPDEVVAKLGADTVRLYLAFIGPYNEAGSYPWNPDSIIGVRRFLERVWRLGQTTQTTQNMAQIEKRRFSILDKDKDVERVLHQTIKKVGEDCAELKFNTAIAQMMIFLNTAEGKGITKQQYATFIRILAPFAPHIAEELWAVLGNKKSVHLAPWPKFDAEKLVADTITIAVQINGKTRAEAKVPHGVSKENQEQAAREAVAERLTGQTITRTIVVQGRLVNFVVATV